MWNKHGNFENTFNSGADLNRQVTYVNNLENTKVAKLTLVGNEDNSVVLSFKTVDEQSFAILEEASRAVGFPEQHAVARDLNLLNFVINPENKEHVALLFQTLTQKEPLLAEIQDEIAVLLDLDFSIERQAIELFSPHITDELLLLPLQQTNPLTEDKEDAYPGSTTDVMMVDETSSMRFFSPPSTEAPPTTEHPDPISPDTVVQLPPHTTQLQIYEVDSPQSMDHNSSLPAGAHIRNNGNIYPHANLQDIINRSFSEIGNRTEQQMPKPGLNSELLEEINFDESAIPPEYLCQLSGTIMTTPVFDPKYPNHIFEESWIITALQTKSENPFNRQPMQAGDLVLHETLRDEISAYVQGLKDNSPTSSPGN